MDDGTSGQRTCRVCGDPIRVNNTYGICSNPLRPECRTTRERARWHRRSQPASPARQCKVCGRALRSGNSTDICSGTGSTAACYRERKNLERAAMGLPPVETPQGVTEVSSGDTFGFWTVMEDGRGVVNYVLCRCECGTERPVTIAKLTEGNSMSCGTQCEARRAANPYLLPGTYGRLEVLEPALRAKQMVRIRCDCGKETEKRAEMIKNNRTTSCGCRMGKFTHGLSRHPLYGTWNGMLDRCANPRATGYEGYGGSGIRVCAGWQGAPAGFLSFIADMGERPAGMTLDRIDVEGGYWCGHCAECTASDRPANCQWATIEQQARNKRSVNKLTRQRNAALAEVERLNQLLAQASRKRPASATATAQDALF